METRQLATPVHCLHGFMVNLTWGFVSHCYFQAKVLDSIIRSTIYTRPEWMMKQALRLVKEREKKERIMREGIVEIREA